MQRARTGHKCVLSYAHQRVADLRRYASFHAAPFTGASLGATMKPIQCECCFCGEGIEGLTGAPLDPCALVLVGNWQAAESEQLSQQFFCHLECFRTKMSDPSYLAIDEMTPGD